MADGFPMTSPAPAGTPSAEDVAKAIINGGWHETRPTYSPTYVNYGKLAALIADAIRDAESAAYGQAAKRAGTVPSWIVDDPGGGNAFDAGYVSACRRISYDILALQTKPAPAQSGGTDAFHSGGER